nr:hypothetical protein [Tanacetum cinerariifolium]
VKAIDRVSPIKSKSKVTGKSNSPKSRKESKKAAVVKEIFVVSKSKVAAVVSEKSTVVKESVVKSIEKSTVVKERDVTSKVGKSNILAVKVSVATESDKETDPVVVADVKASVVAAVEMDNPKVTSKVSDESVKAPIIKESVKVSVVKNSVKVSSVVADKPSSVVADKVDVVVKKNVKASSVVADKASSVVADMVDVVVKKSVKASRVFADKSSSVVADKVDVVKDNINVVADKVVKENVLFVVADKASNINVVAVADKASNALKNKPAGKGKKPVVRKDKDKPKNITPDVVKEKFKPNPKQKLETDVVDYSSDEADRKRKKLKIKASLKRKRDGSDSSDSSKLDTKSIKQLISKLEKKVKKEEYDEESVPKKGKKKDKQLTPKEGDKIEVTLSKIHDMLGVPFGGYSLFDLDEREDDHEFVRKWAGKADGLKGQICLDVVRRLREDSDFFLKIQDLIKKAKEKLSLICAKRVMLKDYMRKASLKCLDDGNGDNVGDDDENGDDDGGNVDNDANDGDRNGDEEDVNEGDKDPNGSNPSFGFSKISLEDFSNDRGPAEKDKVVEGNPTEQGTVVEGNQGDKMVILSKSHEIHSESHVIYFESHVIRSESHVVHFESHKKLFARHLKQYGHIRHTQVAKVKNTIPKLKWKTKENFHDYGIFTMLHMETFDSGPTSNLDFGLPVESQLQCDMLRRLRFKFATKILLHEINVHAGKMLELAKEFDKTDHVEKMAIIVDAFKKREERDCI